MTFLVIAAPLHLVAREDEAVGPESIEDCLPCDRTPPSCCPTQDRIALDNIYCFNDIYIEMDLTVFQTLADPSRLRIVEALRRGEVAVNGIVSRVGIQASQGCRDTCASCTNRVSFASALTGRSAFIRCVRSLSANSTLGSRRYRSVWEARLDRFGEALGERNQKNPRLNARKHPNEQQITKTKDHHRADLYSFAR